ncbi:CHAD domain-containing protein [Actinokineospora sp.]|uniref:CHAD domain-containing protein n=1 Tax=Actinokineospora sp. TaxID=1872133 RepID=UPI004037DB8A
MTADLGLAAEPLVAGPKDTAAAHVRARLDEQARALVSNREGARVGTDPEHVHEMRVAVRRARAALKADRDTIPDADALQVELKWLGGALGAVRDFDVQLDHLRAEAATFDEVEQAAVETLLGGLVADRRGARRRMLGTLRGKRFDKLIRSLAAAVAAAVPDQPADAPAEETALVEVVRKPHRKLMKAVAALGEDPPDDNLHALRIQGKRLRYAAELAAPGAKKAIKELVKATKSFQDTLGDHQDAVLAEETIRRLVNELGDGATIDVVFVAGRLVERERARKADRRSRWRSAVDEVDARARELLD